MTSRRDCEGTCPGVGNSKAITVAERMDSGCRVQSKERQAKRTLGQWIESV
jgi:hypothetical protein